MKSDFKFNYSNMIVYISRYEVSENPIDRDYGFSRISSSALGMISECDDDMILSGEYDNDIRIIEENKDKIAGCINICMDSQGKIGGSDSFGTPIGILYSTIADMKTFIDDIKFKDKKELNDYTMSRLSFILQSLNLFMQGFGFHVRIESMNRELISSWNGSATKLEAAHSAMNFIDEINSKGY